MPRLYSLIVKPSATTPFVPPPDGEIWYLRHAALSVGGSMNEYATLSFKTTENGNQWISLGTLRPERSDFMTLDMPLNEYVEFRVKGTASVHLSGTLVAEEEGALDLGDEDEEEVEEEIMKAALMNGGEGKRQLMEMLGKGELDEMDEGSSSEEEPELVTLDEEEKPSKGAAAKKKTKKVTGEGGGLHAVKGEGSPAKPLATSPVKEASVSPAKPPATSPVKSASVSPAKPPAASPLKESFGSSKKKATTDPKGQTGSAEEDAPAQLSKAAAKKLKRKQRKEAKAAAAVEEIEPQRKQQKMDVTPSPEGAFVKGSKPATDPKPTTTSSPSTHGDLKKKKIRRFSNGYVIESVSYGPVDGPVVEPGKTVSIKYEGRLEDGTVFDKTRGDAVFTFQYGQGEVVKGLDKGMDEMRVGDKRRLTVPAKMGYGSQGALPAIPPNSDLSFDIEVMKIE